MSPAYGEGLVYCCKHEVSSATLGPNVETGRQSSSFLCAFTPLRAKQLQSQPSLKARARWLRPAKPPPFYFLLARREIAAQTQ